MATIKVQYSELSTESLRRIYSRLSEFAPENRREARTEMIRRGVMVNIETALAETGSNFVSHIVSPERNWTMICGAELHGCRSRSFELWDRATCPDCVREYLRDILRFMRSVSEDGIVS